MTDPLADARRLLALANKATRHKSGPWHTYDALYVDWGFVESDAAHIAAADPTTISALCRALIEAREAQEREHVLRLKQGAALKAEDSRG